MIRMLKTTFLLVIVTVSGLALNQSNRQMEPIRMTVDLVDPFIGTAGHGHTFPGATTPFGMVQLSPDTGTEGWDWCSGYHRSDHSIMGFSHTHLSGTGASDYGDILFMPFTGQAFTRPGSKEDPDEGYRSRFAHDREEAQAGYYSVYLDDTDILVELTAAPRTGVQRYYFLPDREARIIVDLRHGIHEGKILDSKLKIRGKDSVEGMRQSSGWAQDQIVFFSSQFSHPIQSWIIFNGDEEYPQKKKISGNDLRIVLNFGILPDTLLLVKTGISAVDEKGARKNREAEVPHWNFNQVREEARASWQEILSRIHVRGNSQSPTVFYTALYHLYIAPNLFTDVDGRYRGMDRKIHKAKDFTNYTVFSLWDTFRATHPLFTILEPERSSDFVRSLLSRYEEGGILPIWELAGNYTGCMIGNHALPVIVDAAVKGIGDYDLELAFTAMKHSVERDHRGLKDYGERGFIPFEIEGESVSKTLEYAYNDWNLARMAQVVGDLEAYAEYLQRSRNYRFLFDNQTGFMRGRGEDGKWIKPFNPSDVTRQYTEANAWQYSFFAPHDIYQLIELQGGEAEFVNMLDMLFESDSQLTGQPTRDISGLLGQYAHGNEPSHHIAYLYNYAGAPWKTQDRVAQILEEMYTAAPDGLCGNEDCGQMSAWYIFSAMGFYPVTPGNTVYALGRPLFEDIHLNLAEDRTFHILTEGVNDGPYIQSVELNGEPWPYSFIDHRQIMAGGKLVFTMGRVPNFEWGRDFQYRPPTFNDDKPGPIPRQSTAIVYRPYVTESRRIFTNTIQVELKCDSPEADIHYTLDGTAPDQTSPVFSSPLLLESSTTVQARAFKPGLTPSAILVTDFKQVLPSGTINPGDLPYPRISLTHAYDPRYSAGGKFGLLDGEFGTTQIHDGHWQGFEENDFEAVVDLGRTYKINRLTTTYLHSPGSWVFLPRQVEYSLSTDGVNFQDVQIINCTVDDQIPDDFILPFEQEYNQAVTRYIRIRAQNQGYNPDWHYEAGGRSWIFIDEIVIEAGK